MLTIRGVIIIAIFYAFICFKGFSQKSNTSCLIRSFQHSLAISILNNKNQRFTYDDHGKIQSLLLKKNSYQNLYLFNGQMFEQDLSVYVFPSRVYCPNNKRFHTPDPKYQYDSSYSFLNGDPINYIDYDGNEGRALVLYQEMAHESPFFDTKAAVTRYRHEFTDPHYRSLSSFMNGEIGPLPDWNGRVHIKAHSSPFGFSVERAKHPDFFRTRGYGIGSSKSQFVVKNPTDQTYTIIADPDQFGMRLAELSENERVDVRSIHLGGCEGEEAAKIYGKAYINQAFILNTDSYGKHFEVGGLKTGTVSMSLGSDLNPAKAQTKLYFTQKGVSIAPNPDKTSKFDEIPIQPDGSYATESLEGERLGAFLNDGVVPADISNFRVTPMRIRPSY